MHYNFSVLLSLYKNEDNKLFVESMMSIINQTLVPDEIVLVVDGPITPALEKSVSKFKSNYPQLIKVYRLNENVGLAKALNVGLSKCNNEIVMRMDTDDLSLPNRFEVLLEAFINDKDLDIVGSFVNDIDSQGKVVGLRKVPTSDDEIKNLIWTCPLIHPAVAYKKESILKIGGYDERLRRRQDYELWYRASYNNLKFNNVEQPLLNYRVDQENYAKKNNLNVQIAQFKIAIRGNKLNELPFRINILVFGNFLYRILPLRIQKSLRFLVEKADPRKI